ncbi:MAG: GTPase Era [Gammaproteobacteria bacterium]
MTNIEHRCGYVAVIGRPNVGKSTLVNALVEHKVSIVSDKPQTTRNRIHGIRSTPGSQMVFIDTPGVHAGHNKPINRLMNKAATSAIPDADVSLFMVAAPCWNEADDQVLRCFDTGSGKVILVLNKIDKIQGDKALLPLLADLKERGRFAAIVPVSATKGRNLEQLINVVEQQLPVGSPIFDNELYTDQSMRFLAAEVIRERLMDALHDELPYALAVSIDDFDEQKGMVKIAATVWVEKAGQKGIVIGKGGRILKLVGTESRKVIESIVGCKVHLVLWVKVREGWSEDVGQLRKFGIGEQ